MQKAKFVRSMVLMYVQIKASLFKRKLKNCPLDVGLFFNDLTFLANQLTLLAPQFQIKSQIECSEMVLVSDLVPWMEEQANCALSNRTCKSLSSIQTVLTNISLAELSIDKNFQSVEQSV